MTCKHSRRILPAAPQTALYDKLHRGAPAREVGALVLSGEAEVEALLEPFSHHLAAFPKPNRLRITNPKPSEN